MRSNEVSDVSGCPSMLNRPGREICGNIVSVTFSTSPFTTVALAWARGWVELMSETGNAPDVSDTWAPMPYEPGAMSRSSNDPSALLYLELGAPFITNPP